MNGGQVISIEQLHHAVEAIVSYHATALRQDHLRTS